MKTFVLDTSVAVAWYLPETFAEAARIWQRQLLRGEVDLVVPSLHYWEFCNVLRTYVRRGEMESAIAEDVYRLHLDAPLRESEPERAGLLSRALEYHASVYDAVYIDLALSLDAPLLTAERTTTSWVIKLGRLARTLDVA